jgi:hypothetical protein
MVFSWFNTSKVDAFVDAEVAYLTRRAPPASTASGAANAKKVEEQLAKSHDLLLRHTMDFVQREKPNMYQKARIANRMKWALMEAKYPADFVDGLAFALAKVAAAAGAQREI